MPLTAVTLGDLRHERQRRPTAPDRRFGASDQRVYHRRGCAHDHPILHDLAMPQTAGLGLPDIPTGRTRAGHGAVPQGWVVCACSGGRPHAVHRSVANTRSGQPGAHCHGCREPSKLPGICAPASHDPRVMFLLLGVVAFRVRDEGTGW